MRRVFTVFVLALSLAAGAAFAAVPNPVFSSVESGESSCRIAWSPVPGASGYNIYLKNETGRFQRLNREPVADNFVRLVDLVNGMPYRFAVSAVTPDGEESPVAVTSAVVPKGYGYKTFPVKGGKSAANYALISTPYIHETKNPKDVFPYLPPYSLNRWRIFSMDKDGYHEFETIKAIEPGKGYWFIAATTTELFLAGRTVDNAEPFYARLQPGWNLIGSPFLYPVEWKDILAHNPETAAFTGQATWEFANGGFHKMGTLLPYHGYLVYNSSGADMNLLIPPVPAAPKLFQETLADTETKPGGAAEGEWLIKISATDGTFRDEDNYIGRPGTQSDVARLDPEPPAWPQHLSLYFTRADDANVKLSSDIGRNNHWLAVVEGGQNKIVTLSWKVIEGRPKAVMIDLANNRKVDMTKTTAYSFTRDGTMPRRFLIREKSSASQAVR